MWNMTFEKSLRMFSPKPRVLRPSTEVMFRELLRRMAFCDFHGGAWSYKCPVCAACQDAYIQMKVLLEVEAKQ